MFHNRIFSVFVIVLSVLFLILGIFYPILTIGGKLTFPFIGEVVLGEQKRSIWSSVIFLTKEGFLLPSFLIFLFSILFPFTKSILLLYATLKQQKNQFIFELLYHLSKWSMADVFVVSIFIAYLSSSSIKGFYARTEKGFYFFITYCLLSLLLNQISVVLAKNENLVQKEIN